MSLSPDQAARHENIEIDLEKCIKPTSVSSLIVEGAGGILTPLNQKHSMLDLMKKVNFPVIIVCRGTLGTMNHSLLTIHMLQHHHIPIHGLIFSGELNTDNQQTIEERGNVKTLFHIPFFPELTPNLVQQWTHQNKDRILETLQ
jgi:dethiobiotin synthetase